MNEDGVDPEAVVIIFIIFPINLVTKKKKEQST